MILSPNKKARKPAALATNRAYDSHELYDMTL